MWAIWEDLTGMPLSYTHVLWIITYHYSRLMGPKQKEMDSIVEKIHKTILHQDSNNYLEYNPAQAKQRSTLFILCGDHGMNEV